MLKKSDILKLGWIEVKNEEFEIESNPRYATWKLDSIGNLTSKYYRIKFYHPDDPKGETHFFGVVNSLDDFKALMRMMRIAN